MATMALNPDDQRIKMSPHDAHMAAALTQPIGPAPIMAPSSGASPQMSPLAPEEKHYNSRLMADYAKDNAPAPQGFLGKLGHAALTVGDTIAPRFMSDIPGTPLYRQAEEQRLEKGEQGISKLQSEEGLQGAQAGNQTAETGKNTEETKEMPGKAESLENYQDAQADKDRAAPDKGWKLTNDYVGPNGEPVEMSPTGEMRIAPNLPQGIKRFTAAPKAAAEGQPRPVQVNGKSAFAIETPNGWVDAQTHAPLQGHVVPIPPQPNYGQLILPTKTQNVLVNGVPTLMGWDEATQTYDKPVGQSATGGFAHQEAQAAAVERGGEQLINDLQANRQKLGTLSSWVQKQGLNTPIADPELAGLQAELATFSALQPALHGFRSHSALETFDKIIGGLQKNPDATIASIRGILKTAHAINPNLRSQPERQPQQGPKPGEVIKGYRFKGGNPAQQSSWEKQ